jgi:hypothetical protein
MLRQTATRKQTAAKSASLATDPLRGLTEP